MSRVAARDIKAKGVRWGNRRRLEFIDFRLLWDGKINRKELVHFFRISIPQASLDIASYIRLAPQNMWYDRKEKVYRATEKFSPLFSRPDSHVFLSQMLSVAEGALAQSATF